MHVSAIYIVDLTTGRRLQQINETLTETMRMTYFVRVSLQKSLLSMYVSKG